ncbi:hypothetical protein AC1031_012819 [Aphanomyces cochlioides]|nr:hypothetical protein AC1031_012819 [Aphanomyces cochlioides]
MKFSWISLAIKVSPWDIMHSNTIGAGYGLDVVGNVMYNGVDYFDKSGDTAVHQTRTGFVPSQGLGIVLVSNSQNADEGMEYNRLCRVRTFILGLLVDIPHDELQAALDASERVADKTPVAPCNPYTFGNKTVEELYAPSHVEKDWLLGEYTTLESAQFNGLALVYERKCGGLFLKYGDFDGALLGQTNWTYAWDIELYAALVMIQVAGDSTARLFIPFGKNYSFYKVPKSRQGVKT